MKRSLLALAILGAFAGTVSAQSSVTLSGSVDAGVRRVGVGPNGAVLNDYRFAGSQSGYNNFTIRGVEDLGGGNTAFFLLQNRFAVGTGAVNGTSNSGGTEPFFRHSWVGLGTNFGDVRLGRMLVPLQDANGNFDPFLTGTVGSVHTGGINATIRANNAIYARSASLGGFRIHAMIAASDNQNQSGTPGTAGLGEIGNPGAQGYFAPIASLATGVAKKPAGFGGRYTAGPIDAALMWDRNAANQKTVGVYGAYDLGFVRPMFQYEKGDNCLTSAATCVPEDIKALSIGLTAPLGPVLLRTGYLKIKSDRTNRDANKFGFGGDYNLSKRTNLYATVGKWSGDRISEANKKAQFDLGVTHRF